MADKYRIILAGGGTLGSVSPLLAIAEKLPAEYLFIGSSSGPERDLVASQNIKYQSIAAGKWRRYFSWQNFKDLGKNSLGVYQAWKIIKKFKPNIVLTAGSFMAVPVAIAARLSDVPVIVHQQDIKLGLANKIMAPLAAKITVTFPEQLRYFPSKKAVLTGNPVRSLRANTVDKPVVVITGGGLGARGLNDFIVSFVPKLLGKYEVHHVLGNDNWDQHLDLSGYIAHRFIKDGMIGLLSKADIIISRAGMSLITEAASLSKALVLVPIPDSHQEKNAEFFARHNAACTVRQGNHQIMDRYLYKLMNNDIWREALGENLHDLFPAQAVENYIQLVKSLIKK